MSEDEQKKPVPPTPSTPPPPKTPTTQPPPPSAQQPTKGPLLSRRAFLIGAVGISTAFTAGALAVSLTPQGGILAPLIPPKADPQAIADWPTLDGQYQSVATTPALYNPSTYSQFFYWPYSSSQSPYYKNVIVRLPDAAGTNAMYPGDPILSKVVALNTTCVHLRCLVNPGYSSNQFRLLCPCHGSQYELLTGIPKAGPAYDLGLNPLPIIKLKVDPDGKTIRAVDIVGEPGIGRTQ